MYIFESRISSVPNTILDCLSHALNLTNKCLCISTSACGEPIPPAAIGNALPQGSPVGYREQDLLTYLCPNGTATAWGELNTTLQCDSTWGVISSQESLENITKRFNCTEGEAQYLSYEKYDHRAFEIIFI